MVLFEPGSDAIPPPEHEKLKEVAQALIQRPKTKLTVLGGYDPKLDGGALRSLQVRRTLAQKLDVRLQPGEDPGPVAFSSAKSQRALENLAAERGGGNALDDFQAKKPWPDRRSKAIVRELTSQSGLDGHGSPPARSRPLPRRVRATSRRSSASACADRELRMP